VPGLQILAMRFRSRLGSLTVGDLPDLGTFGDAFEGFMRATTLAAERTESEVTVRLREHLGVDPRELPSTGRSFRWLSRRTCSWRWMPSWRTRRFLSSRLAMQDLVRSGWRRFSRAMG
jgi:hypothetical protein